MLRLESSVRLVIIQFSFKRVECVPESIKMVMPETHDEAQARKKRSVGGQLVIPSTENTSLFDFLNDLGESDYKLVGAFHQLRDYKNMVRFTFARRKVASPRKEFLAKRDSIFSDLREMCRTVMWQVCVYRNPFFSDGEPTDEHTFQVCPNVRTPLFRPDGTPVTVWQKDKNGEKVGKAPLPLTPDHCLRAIDGVVDLQGWDA